MTSTPKLSVTGGIILFVVGGAADAAKFVLNLLFGIGLILDPMLISPLTWVIFYITLSHHNISMMSGKNWQSGWVNLVIAEVPGIDIVPNWTAYAAYLNITYGDYGKAVDFMSNIASIMR